MTRKNIYSTSPLFLLWTFPFNTSMNCEFLRSHFLSGLIIFWFGLSLCLPFLTLTACCSYMKYFYQMKSLKLFIYMGNKTTKLKIWARKENLFPHVKWVSLISSYWKFKDLSKFICLLCFQQIDNIIVRASVPFSQCKPKIHKGAYIETRKRLKYGAGIFPDLHWTSIYSSLTLLFDTSNWESVMTMAIETCIE